MDCMPRLSNISFGAMPDASKQSYVCNLLLPGMPQMKHKRGISRDVVAVLLDMSPVFLSVWENKKPF
jgi:DNA-binding transcriptional regulator YiaG